MYVNFGMILARIPTAEQRFKYKITQPHVRRDGKKLIIRELKIGSEFEYS